MLETEQQAHDEMLNDAYDLIRIGSLTYEPSEVLRAADPIAYRTGFNDWLDGEIRAGNAPPEAEDWTASV